MAPRMGELNVCSFIFLFTLLELVLKTTTSVHGNSHDFIPGDSEGRYYVVDGIPANVHKELNSASGVRMSSIEENVVYNSNFNLKFEPPLLDFKRRHLGMPHHEKVTLFNINKNQTIHMSSISGNTVHFHSSFFEDKVIPPLGNTTFNVVFLGREEGEIESSLFIHTSEGSFKYSVKGSSVGSPYRLRPLVGAKVPLNSTYSPLIYMHNPHNTPMQIVEIYSSGGEFHLELPSGELEGPKHLWEIPPYHTKPVIRVRFMAFTEKNHTAYIRIKVNNSEEVLVVPLEVEVAPQHGLYFPENVLDFGMGGSGEKPKQIKLLLYNSWKKAIRIQNIVTTPVSRAVTIEFQPVKVPPDSSAAVEVATIMFDWKEAFDSGHVSGKLIIKSNHSAHKLVIPYTAVVLEGSLHFNASATQYCSDVGPSLDVRNFTVTNNYRVPLALTEVSMPKHAHAHFMVQNFTARVLKPRESCTLFRLAFKRDSVQLETKLKAHLTLHTNLSKISVPLLYYNGRLMKEIPSRFNETFLNFGLVGSGRTKWLRFALYNNNPVAVELREWRTNLTSALVELVGFMEANVTTLFDLDEDLFDYVHGQSTKFLPPGQYALFRVAVIAPMAETSLLGAVFVKTQFEQIVIPARLSSAPGELLVLTDKPVAGDCFPGKLCVQELHVRSLFTRPMEVVGITGALTQSVAAVGFKMGTEAGQRARIEPLATSHIGQVSFDPGVGCRNEYYLGNPSQAAATSKWIHSLSLPPNTYRSDVSLFNILYDKYVSLTASSPWQNITVKLDTTEVRDYSFDIGVQLSWPELMPDIINSSTVDFPLTQVGNKTYRDLRLTNPSSHPVSLQLVMEWVYLKDGKKMIGAPGRFENLFRDFYNVTPWDFVMESVDDPASRRLRVPAHHESLTFLIDPGETVTARIGFVPRKPGISSTLLFVRNNLTALDIVRLTGKAVEAHFKFGNRKPGSVTPLLFELAEKHLKDCEREKHRKFPAPNLTVKRSFTARNTGELPISVVRFSVNDLPCEGYGFRVLNCEPFDLPPNGTRKVDIAFTPDFTLARIQRTLSIETSLGVPVNYTLVTTLPPFFLAACSGVLGRPPWEPILYHAAVGSMVFLALCVLAAAFLESDRILKCALAAMSKDRDARLGAEYRPVYADVHKPPEKPKPAEAAPDWPRGPDKPKENGVTPKAASWVRAEDRRLSLEPEAKEQAAITRKFDEPDTSTTAATTTTLAKNKKKLGKRNSTNSDASENVPEAPAKKSWGNVFNRGNNHTACGPKLKVPAAVAEPEPKGVAQAKETPKKPQESRKELKRLERINKSFNNNNKKNKPPPPEPVACSEEESSSTTTDSSNNEEMEKERESSGTSLSERTHKSTPKKAKGKSVDYRDNYEGDCDDDDYDREAHKRRWKPANHKPPTPEATPKVEPVSPKPLGMQLPFKLKTNGTNRERKDKNALKRGAEKSKPPEVCHVLPVRASPPPRNVWMENRASFSDVVARNDSPSYSTVLAPRKPAPPPPAPASYEVPTATQYEVPAPRKAPPMMPAGLGPIGPKKAVNNAWVNFTEGSEAQLQESSSLFASPFTHEPAAHLPMVAEQYDAELWQQQDAIARMQMHQEQIKLREREAEEYRQQNHNQFAVQESEPWQSLWDPLYIPAVGEASYSPVEPAAPAPHAAALWWSSVVDSTWSAPWSDNSYQPVEEDVERVQAYDPFRSLSNIWTPQSADPWNSNPRNE